ncbi:hypothetical protein ACOJCO_004134 [Cronobacter dublinensis]
MAEAFPLTGTYNIHPAKNSSFLHAITYRSLAPGLKETFISFLKQTSEIIKNSRYAVGIVLQNKDNETTAINLVSSHYLKHKFV